MNQSDLPPAARALLQQATRRETPCGDGVMAWHLWGTGEPVVMLHGGSGNWTHWVRNIPAVLAAGYMAVVPDLPGFGDSATPPGGGDADAAVAPVALGLQTLLGARTCTLAAFSFGSLVAALLAAEQPGRVSSLLTNPRFDGLTLVPDAGHWVQFEAAERFNAWVADALAAGSASGR